jgi:hypothetical protein
MAFQHAPQHHPVRYWLQESPQRPQNFGDYLTELFLDELFVLPSFPADAYHLIGSVIAENQMRQDLTRLRVSTETGRIAFWGCGMRSKEPPSAWVYEHAHFFGVRGPHSRDALGLPQETVLGDPALLLPLLHPKARRRRGKTLCVVHILDKKSDADIQSETGADRVVRAGIPGSRESLLAFLDMLTGADFVLCGALHAAITACAYGVPFAYYDSGYINVPFKWDDFAASVGMPCLFVKNVAAGRALYEDVLAPAYRPLPLLPLLSLAPFAVRPAALLKTMRHDGLISQAALRRLLAQLDTGEAAQRARIADAQAEWLCRAETAWQARPAAA